MAGLARTGKRKLQRSPLKTRPTGSDESEPKKIKQNGIHDSPMSSPIKGPLKECSDQNSPSFVAKCFYGLKKSELSKENKPAAPVNKTSSSDEGSRQSNEIEKFDLGNGKTVCPKSYVDKLMLKRVAVSPVKQAVLQSCSLTEFRKIFRDEYKELECEVKKQNCRTGAVSRIVTRMEDEEDDTIEDEDVSDSSSDDEVTFKVHNNGLDKEKESKTINGAQVRTLNTRRVMLHKGKQEISSSSDEESDEPDSEVEDISKDKCENISGATNGSKIITSPRKATVPTTPSSCERKFFKTRSPLDSAKASSLVSRKGFMLKFHPKSPKTVNGKMVKSRRERRSGPAPKKRNGTLTEDASGLLPITNVTKKLNCSTETTTQPSGFTFAPGFMSEGKEDIGSTNPNLAFDDDDLEVNKSSSQTYESSPPRNKKTAAENTTDSSISSDNIGLFMDSSPTHVQTDLEFSVPSQDLNNERQENHEASDKHETTPSNKLFPIFSRKKPQTQSYGKKDSSSASKQDKPSPSTRMMKAAIKDGQSQMIIDAGQKKFGATQCPTCSMVYCHADPEDEAAHAKFHKRLIEVLKFPGWKKERVVQEYAMDLGRVLLVLPDDPKYARKKIEEVNQVMARELGFPDVNTTLNNPFLKIFLYVQDREIAGCCVAEPITEGYRIIPGDLDRTDASGKRPWCCSKVPESACIGISRLWVAGEKRKCGIATKLVDCVRQWFDYGTLTPKHKIAFSDPTPDGRKFAQTYMGTPTFLVYKYNHQ